MHTCLCSFTGGASSSKEKPACSPFPAHPTVLMCLEKQCSALKAVRCAVTELKAASSTSLPSAYRSQRSGRVLHAPWAASSICRSPSLLSPKCSSALSRPSASACVLVCAATSHDAAGGFLRALPLRLAHFTGRTRNLPPQRLYRRPARTTAAAAAIAATLPPPLFKPRPC